MGGSILSATTPSTSVPIGTGPFQVIENTNNQLRLKVFASFFRTRPFLDEIMMYFFPQLYDNQSSSVAERKPTNFYQYPYTNSTPHYRQKTAVDNGSKLLTLNGDRGKLAKDPFLREAVFHLLKPEKMIKQLQGNRYAPASRLIQSTENASLLYRSVSSRKKLLNSSSYNGKTFHLYSYHGAGNELDGKWIQQELGNAGIKVALHFLPFEELVRQDLSKADMLLGEQLADESRLLTYLSFFHGSQSLAAHHLPDWNRERLECLTSEGLTEQAFIMRLQQEEANLCLTHYYVFLYRLKQYAMYPDYVESIEFNALGWVDYTKLWYDFFSSQQGGKNE